MYNLQIIKLTSGESIIGQVQSIDPADLEEYDISEQILTLTFIKHPMVINEHYDEHQKCVSLSRWVPYSDDELFCIDRNNIILFCEPMSSLVELYFEKCSDFYEPDPQELLEFEPETEQSLEEAQEFYNKMNFLSLFDDEDSEH